MSVYVTLNVMILCINLTKHYMVITDIHLFFISTRYHVKVSVVYIFEDLFIFFLADTGRHLDTMGRPMKLFIMLLSIAMLGVIQYTRVLNIWHRSTDQVIITPNIANSIHQVERDPNHTDHMITYLEPHHVIITPDITKSVHQVERDPNHTDHMITYVEPHHVIITPDITKSVHQVERDPNHTDHMITYVEPHHEDELRTLFYQELSEARNLVLNYSRSNKFRDPCEGGNKVNKVLHHTRDEESPIRYIHDVSKYVTGSITVLWKRIEPRSVPVFQYYRPASTNCVYLEHRSIAKPINLTECTHDTNTTLTNNTDNRTIWTYVSVLPNAVVNGDGYVISNQVKLSEMSCHRKANSNCFSKTKEVYDEVFTITQYWGEGFFHGTIENLPRLAPFIPYLLQVSQRKIWLMNCYIFSHVTYYISYCHKINPCVPLSQSRTLK